jgi:2-methylisocitrate lyase-like PEP mutase family enzyme
MLQKQIANAHQFRQQHLDKSLLLLPNIWDVLSAKLVAATGFRSLATASIATAWNNGYADGEQIPFAVLLKIVGEITSAVPLPLSVDFERGFADELGALQNNVRSLLDLGVVGINIEDGLADAKGLETADQQCRKIEAIRDTARDYGVPLVINARTDLFLQGQEKDKINQAIARAGAYKDAGADCFYPILVGNYEDIARLTEAINMPVNIGLLPAISDLKKLEAIGVARVSLGPGLMKAALGKMKQVADGLLQYDAEPLFGDAPLSADFFDSLIP